MKRGLYLIALFCLAGLGLCLMHLYDYSNTVSDTIDAAKDGDRLALADLRDPTSLHGDGDLWLDRAGLFFLGFCVAGFLAKRAK